MSVFIEKEPLLVDKGWGSKVISEFLRLNADAYEHIFVAVDSKNRAVIKAMKTLCLKKLMCQKRGKNLDGLEKTSSLDLYHVFENGISHESDSAMKQWLSQFDLYDFLSMPIVFDLISSKKMQLLK